MAWGSTQGASSHRRGCSRGQVGGGGERPLWRAQLLTEDCNPHRIRPWRSQRSMRPYSPVRPPPLVLAILLAPLAPIVVEVRAPWLQIVITNVGAAAGVVGVIALCGSGGETWVGPWF
jgi:hypothetical protein